MGRVRERDLERWIVEHADEAGVGTVIGNQLNVPHGRLDILSYEEDTTTEGPYGPILWYHVIELKTQPLRESDIGQVLRYTHDIKRIIQDYSCAHLIHKAVSDVRRETVREIAHYSEALVNPWLIGPSIDKNTLAACEGADVRVYLYTPTESGFEFEPTWWTEDGDISHAPEYVHWDWVHDMGQPLISYINAYERYNERIKEGQA